MIRNACHLTECVDINPGDADEPRRAFDEPWRGRYRGLIIGSALFLIAFALRSYQFDHIGLDHFDEGVYVLSAEDVTADIFESFYPSQIFNSPPAYFLTTAAMKAATGLETDRAAILVNIVFGSLTVVLLWMITSSWLGSAAGLGAGILAAFSQFHIGLSRAGLTDVVFAFWLFFGVYLLIEAMQNPSWTRSAFAGLAIGLAWNTKYHGFLACVIVILAWIAGRIWGSRSHADRVTLRAFLIAAGVAGLCVVPWGLFVLQQAGGVREFFDYYDTFVNSGPRSLGSSSLIHLQQQVYFSGRFDWASVPLAAVALLASLSRVGTGVVFLLLSASLLPLAVWGESWTVVAPLAFTGGVFLLLDRPDIRGWALISVVASWLFLTPFYRPYARLALPLVLGSYVLAGYCLARMCQVGAPSKSKGRLAIGFFLISLIGSGFASSAGGNPWRSSEALRQISAQITSVAPAGAQIIVRRNPALAFYLYRAGYDALSFLEEDPVDWSEVGTTTQSFAAISGQSPSSPIVGAELVGSWTRMPPDHELLDLFRFPYPDPSESQLVVNLYRLPTRPSEPPGASTPDETGDSPYD